MLDGPQGEAREFGPKINAKIVNVLIYVSGTCDWIPFVGRLTDPMATHMACLTHDRVISMMVDGRKPD